LQRSLLLSSSSLSSSSSSSSSSNNNITYKLLNTCKRDAAIFLVVVTIINLTAWVIAVTDNGAIGFSLFEIPLTLLETVVMIFTSLSLLQLQEIQHCLILSISSKEGITTHQYLMEKSKIENIQKETYWSHQVVTVTAAINTIAFIGVIILSRVFLNSYLDTRINYAAVISEYFAFFGREIIIFYYILFKVATINSNNDKIKEALARKCWEIDYNKSNYSNSGNSNSSKSSSSISNSNESDTNGYQYMIMYQDASTFPTVFKLGTLEVLLLLLLR